MNERAISAPTALLTVFSTWARVTGVVIAAGYLVGAVRGPIVAVIGGLALMTLGRGLLAARDDEALAGTALALLAGALGVGALRWSSLDLGEMRAAQEVLGPTLLVGSSAVVGAAWAALVGGVVALAAWTGALHPTSRLGWAWSAAESGVAAWAIVTVFWGPAMVVWDAGRLATWVGSVVVIAAAGTGLAATERRLGRSEGVIRWAGLGVAGLAIAVASALVAGAL